MNPHTERILLKYEENISTLAFLLRDFLLKNLNDIIEQPDAKANIIGSSYGPGYKDLICTIIPSKKGIKLGFNRGSELPDPKKLLTGSGKVHKYVEIKSTKDFSSPHLRRLLKEGVKMYRQRIG